MAKWQKGKEKTGGKKAGTPNKRTVDSLKRIEYVLGLLDETIDEDLQAIEPKERARMWQDLQEYMRPKLARTELTGKDGTELNQTLLIERTILTKPSVPSKSD